MANKNDEKILGLKKQIEEKKAKLGELKKFVPLTNCSLHLDGVHQNIRVLKKEDLVGLLVKLNLYYMSAKELNLLDEYKISGYSVKEWMEDIKARLNILSRQEEEKALQQMEEKLHTLLSEDKKVELEIDEMETLLKEI